MRARRAVAVATLMVLVPLAGAVDAKFGISKTRVTLTRLRPPDILLVGDTVTVRVTTDARGVSDRQLDQMRDRIEDGLVADGRLRLVEGGAENAVVVSVDDVEARIDDTVVYEDKYVKTGERQEWNEKKKRYETKDVYGYRREPVRVRTVRGRADVRVRVETPTGERSADASATYQDEFKGDVRVPEEAASESLLERRLLDEAADRAAAAVSLSREPVEALLAVDGELKEGNRLAQAGLWREALDAWTARTFKGDKEAARLHNVGLAHEALAYAQPLEGPEHISELTRAGDFYRQALALDPKEKYFAEPVQRLETSRDYAERAQQYAEDSRQWRETKGREPRRARRDTPALPAKTPAQAPESLGASAELVLALRNGSFESGLDGWTVGGKGTLTPDPHRGRVLQASAAGGPTTLAQAVDLDLRSAPAATLSLDYRVASGEGVLRALVVFEDAGGRTRTSTLEVTSGDAPGGWTAWRGDLLALRPRPARLKEVRVVVEGGQVLLDDVMLSLR